MYKFSRVLFYGSIAYYVISVLLNIESTLHLNATQYVPDGEKPDPIRIAEILRDIIYPAYNTLVLISLSYITKHFSKRAD